MLCWFTVTSLLVPLLPPRWKLQRQRKLYFYDVSHHKTSWLVEKKKKKKVLWSKDSVNAASYFCREQIFFFLPPLSLRVLEPTPSCLIGLPNTLTCSWLQTAWLPSRFFAYCRRRLLLLCHFLNISIQPSKTGAHLSCLQPGALRELELERPNTHRQ